MTRWLISLISVLLLAGHSAAQDVEVYGYFEPQYTGLHDEDEYYQMCTNKVRVDLASRTQYVEFGADLVHLLYTGKKEWSILDFVPETIASSVEPQIRPFFQISYRDTFFLDNAYARFLLGRFALTVGKQQMSLGTGYFANPTDLFNVKELSDPTYEQTGHSGGRVDVQFASRMSFMAIYSPVSDKWSSSGKLVRLKAGFGRFDFSIVGHLLEYRSTDFYTLTSLLQSRTLLGADFVGELAGFGVWGEGAYNILEEDEDFYEWILGSDYTFESGLYAMIEYHRNSQLPSDHQERNLNDWVRFIVGETKSISRDQVYGLVQYPLTDLATIGGSVLASPSDRSAALVPVLNYSLYENVDLTLMLNLFAGDEEKTYSTSGTGGFLRCRVYF